MKTSDRLGVRRPSWGWFAAAGLEAAWLVVLAWLAWRR